MGRRVLGSQDCEFALIGLLQRWLVQEAVATGYPTKLDGESSGSNCCGGVCKLLRVSALKALGAW